MMFARMWRLLQEPAPSVLTFSVPDTAADVLKLQPFGPTFNVPVYMPFSVVKLNGAVVVVLVVVDVVVDVVVLLVVVDEVLDDDVVVVVPGVPGVASSPPNAVKPSTALKAPSPSQVYLFCR